MAKKASSNLIFSLTALAVSVIVMVGVIFAWFVSNKEVGSGGIGINVVDDDPSGVYIETFNGGKVPDDGYRMYPEDIIKLGLRTTRDITAFNVKLSSPGTTAIDFIDNFKDREDLLNGHYKRVVTINDIDGEIKKITDFDIDAFLDDRYARLSESLTQPEIDALGSKHDYKMAHKMAFLYEFAASNCLVDVMVIKLVGIGEVDSSGNLIPFKNPETGETMPAEDYSSSPIELKIDDSAKTGKRSFSILGSRVPDGHSILGAKDAGGVYTTNSDYITEVKEQVNVETEAVENVITGMDFFCALPFLIQVEFGHNRNGEPQAPLEIDLTGKTVYGLVEALTGEEVDGSGNSVYSKYFNILKMGNFLSKGFNVLNYNCFEFQEMNIGFLST